MSEGKSSEQALEKDGSELMAPSISPSMALTRLTNAPNQTTPGDVLTLQRTLGNRAVTHLLQGGHSVPPRFNSTTPQVQRKALTVGTANHAFEQRADAAADAIMGMPSPDVAANGAPEAALQPCIQRSELQSAGGSAAGAGEGGFQAGADFASRLSGLGSGKPLDRATRNFMEPRYGSDLGHLRIQDGPAAAALSKEIGARAFTHKNHIVMGEGAYSPGTTSGRHLLAHEITHTFQQGATGDNVIQRAVYKSDTDRTRLDWATFEKENLTPYKVKENLTTIGYRRFCRQVREKFKLHAPLTSANITVADLLKEADKIVDDFKPYAQWASAMLSKQGKNAKKPSAAISNQAKSSPKVLQGQGLIDSTQSDNKRLNAKPKRSKNARKNKMGAVQQSLYDYENFTGDMRRLQNTISDEELRKLYLTLGYGGTDEVFGLRPTNLAFLDESADKDALNIANAKTIAKVDVVDGLGQLNNALGDVGANKVLRRTFGIFKKAMEKAGGTDYKLRYYRDLDGIGVTVITDMPMADFKEAFEQAQKVVRPELDNEYKKIESPTKKLDIRLVDCTAHEDANGQNSNGTAWNKWSRRIDRKNAELDTNSGAQYHILYDEFDRSKNPPAHGRDRLLALYEDQFKAAWTANISNDVTTADEAWKKAKAHVNRDKLSSLYTREQRVEAGRKIYNNVSDSDWNNTVYVVVDIGNLGGMGTMYGKDDAGQLIPRFVDKIRTVLKGCKSIKKMEGYRHGGDELSYYLTFHSTKVDATSNGAKGAKKKVTINEPTNFERIAEDLMAQARKEVSFYVAKLRGAPNRPDENESIMHSHSIGANKHRKKGDIDHFPGTEIYYGVCKVSIDGHVAKAGKRLEEFKENPDYKTMSGDVAEKLSIDKQQSGGLMIHSQNTFEFDHKK